MHAPYQVKKPTALTRQETYGECQQDLVWYSVSLLCLLGVCTWHLAIMPLYMELCLLSWWDGYPLWCALPTSTGLESVCRDCTGWLKTPENVPYFLPHFLPHCLLLPKLWLTKEVAAPNNVYVGGTQAFSTQRLSLAVLTRGKAW